MNLYDLIKDAYHDDKIIRDIESPRGKISRKLLSYMILEKPSIVGFIFDDNVLTKASIIDIFQENFFDLENFLPEKLVDHKIFGRNIQFVDGMATFGGKRGKYVEYYEDALKGYLPPNRNSLVIGVDAGCISCILGVY